MLDAPARSWRNRAHAGAGIAATSLIALFWSSTVVVELSGSVAAIVWVKTAIAWGLAVLIPLLVMTAMSGRSLARGWDHPVVARKTRRMRVVAANGLFLLVPSALVLAVLARAGTFDTLFVVVQAIELVAGAINLTLLSRNFADGRALVCCAP